MVLAEDNLDHQQIVAEILRRLGHEVTVVDDGRAALDAVTRRRPDMLVADVDMPYVDGVQLCRTLRADPALADLPIMLLTAYLPPSDPLLTSAGATTVMAKPFKMQDLTAALHELSGATPAPRPDGLGAVTVAAGTGLDRLVAAAGDAGVVRALLASLDAGVMACDAAGRLMILNQGLRRFGAFGDFGGSAEPVPLAEWTHRARLRHHDGSPLPTGEMPLLRALAGEDVREAHLLADDDSGQDHWLSVNARPIRDTAGAIAGAVATVRDITAEYRADRFQECTTQVLDVLSRSPEAATLGDQILHAVGTTLGWPYLRLWLVDEVGNVLRPAAMFLAADEPPLPLPDSMARGEGLAGLCWQRGDLLWVPDVHAADSPLLPEVVATTTCRAAGAVPVRSGEQVTGVVTFFSYSTQEPEPALAVLLRGIAGTIGAYLERRRAEDLAVRLAATTDEYIALVGHELRTPLTSISAYTDLIAESPDATRIGDVRNLIEVIQRNNGRLRALIDSLLDLAALESGHAPMATVAVDLAGVVAAAADAITATAREHRITLDVRRPAELTVPGDPKRLRQVVDSLLSNAVKFGPDGSTVTVALTTADDIAVLTVADTGTGIPPDENPSVFRSLYRGRNAHHAGIPGAGLGLTLSRVVVERHHGTITLSRNRPAGTTATVRLPRTTGAAPAG